MFLMQASIMANASFIISFPPGSQLLSYLRPSLFLSNLFQEWASVLLVHTPEEYFLDQTNGMAKLYNDAHDYSNTTAQRLKIEISSRRRVIGKPHIAFEHDVIGMFLATFETAEVATGEEGGKAWIDSSTGTGELETTDPDYAYLYLKMPETVMEIDNVVSSREVRIATAGYRKYYHPTLSENN